VTIELSGKGSGGGADEFTRLVAAVGGAASNSGLQLLDHYHIGSEAAASSVLLPVFAATKGPLSASSSSPRSPMADNNADPFTSASSSHSASAAASEAAFIDGSWVLCANALRGVALHYSAAGGGSGQHTSNENNAAVGVGKGRALPFSVRKALAASSKKAKKDPSMAATLETLSQLASLTLPLDPAEDDERPEGATHGLQRPEPASPEEAKARAVEDERLQPVLLRACLQHLTRLFLAASPVTLRVVPGEAAAAAPAVVARLRPPFIPSRSWPAAMEECLLPLLHAASLHIPPASAAIYSPPPPTPVQPAAAMAEKSEQQPASSPLKAVAASALSFFFSSSSSSSSSDGKEGDEGASDGATQGTSSTTNTPIDLHSLAPDFSCLDLETAEHIVSTYSLAFKCLLAACGQAVDTHDAAGILSLSSSSSSSTSFGDSINASFDGVYSMWSSLLFMAGKVIAASIHANECLAVTAGSTAPPSEGSTPAAPAGGATAADQKQEQEEATIAWSTVGETASQLIKSACAYYCSLASRTLEIAERAADKKAAATGDAGGDAAAWCSLEALSLLSAMVTAALDTARRVLAVITTQPLVTPSAADGAGGSSDSNKLPASSSSSVSSFLVEELCSEVGASAETMLALEERASRVRGKLLALTQLQSMMTLVSLEAEQQQPQHSAAPVTPSASFSLRLDNTNNTNDHSGTSAPAIGGAAGDASLGDLAVTPAGSADTSALVVVEEHQPLMGGGEAEAEAEAALIPLVDLNKSHHHQHDEHHDHQREEQSERDEQEAEESHHDDHHHHKQEEELGLERLRVIEEAEAEVVASALVDEIMITALEEVQREEEAEEEAAGATGSSDASTTSSAAGGAAAAPQEPRASSASQQEDAKAGEASTNDNKEGAQPQQQQQASSKGFLSALWGVMMGSDE
jgi:hypothetical protein